MVRHPALEEFVKYLTDNGHPGLKIDQYPDEENPGDIDAIAGKFAIEHTSLDTLPHQRRNTDWFMQAIGDLQRDLCEKLAYRLEINIEYEDVIRGQNWSDIKERLRDWILTKTTGLEDGTFAATVEGVPFQLHCLKASNRISGLFVRRIVPPDTTLVNRTRKLLDRKIKKLSKYKPRKYTTILLVESYDQALMSSADMLNNIREAYDGGFPKSIDQVWFAHSSPSGHTVFTDFSEHFTDTPR